MADRLHGKVALVTGAARGIGLAIARAFVAEGATVRLTDLDGGAAGAAAASLGAMASSAPLDVRDEGGWEAVVGDLLAHTGRLDILVNNAGITGLETGAVHDPEHASLQDWQAVHRTNLDGVFLGCRQAIRAMRPDGRGSIINMSSRSGLVGVPAAAAYASSKAAIRNHTKTVALWCAQQRLAIRCNSIHPGAILTPIWEPMLGHGTDRAERMAALVADTPLRRFGLPEEVAAVAVLLGSDETGYITGAELTIDGGLLAGSSASPG